MSLLQHHSLKASVIWGSAGPTLTSIHDYWKNTALTIWTFVGKVMSLFFLIQCIGFQEEGRILSGS